MSERSLNEPIEARESQQNDSSSSESASLRLHEEAYSFSDDTSSLNNESDDSTSSDIVRNFDRNSPQLEENRTNPLDAGLNDLEIVDGEDSNSDGKAEGGASLRDGQENELESVSGKEVSEAAESTQISDKDLDNQIEEFEKFLSGFENIDEKRAGQIGEHLRQTFNRLEGVNPQQYGKADPSTQVGQMMDSMKQVMDSDGKVDGVQVHSQEDRTKIVEDMARSAADPKENINQGKHNDCVAQSIRLAHMTTDPADAVRIGAEVATTGGATLNGAEGDDPYQVSVETHSLKLDKEAKNATDQSAGEGGRRGGFGQMYSLALNEAANDFRAKREDPAGNTRYQYRQGVPNEDYKTGEITEKYLRGSDGTFRNVGGVSDGPGNGPRDAALMARLAMGETDGLFVDSSRVEAFNMGGIDGVTDYDSPQDLQAKAGEYEERTGRPARHFVDTRQLPGASEHGGNHQMALDFNPETGKFDDDTQTWGARGDAHPDLTAEQVQFASSLGRQPSSSETPVDSKGISDPVQAALNTGLSAEALADLYKKPL